jgi:uncharacterized OB-fold protein
MTTEQPNIQTREGQEELKRQRVRPVPLPDPLTAPYWEAAKRHELRIQRCTACRTYMHPPLAECRKCGSSALEWALLSGKCTVYSFIVDYRLMVPSFDEPYVVAQVNPVEADDDIVRITANIKECDIHDVSIGMSVEVFFEVVTPDVTLPQFRPAPKASRVLKK